METQSLIHIFIVAFGLTFVALAVLAIRHEYSDRNPKSNHLAATIAAIVILLIFYPMTIAPVGPYSNGGLLGLGSLLIASGLSWSAFTRNRRARWIRRLIQLPVTAFATVVTIHDGICQCLAEGWLQT